eukprot:CAMPEP_0118903100 /NCGR_PEP_ID=MMETSP1166-20130328/8102_1 /TAXON_ID=1104430 /ORGANISM="Chrysoreinhardia sp, Strain CCMP3193" /LENGTH=41 /DNA_ID= /DNA_START= /DNA_END= /DNA_ORIENTATION=
MRTVLSLETTATLRLAPQASVNVFSRVGIGGKAFAYEVTIT